MIKKILYSGASLALIAAISFGFYLGSEQIYEPRKAKSAAEPYSMQWAKIDLNTGEYNPGAYNDVKNMITQRVSRAGELGLEFISRGPDNVGGRTRAIVELIGKPDTLLAGSVTGGLWVSYNGGGTWEAHEQFNNLDSSSSIIASMHQDTISKKIYIGTGSSFDDNATSPAVGWPGFGIYVSEDEGVTFQHLTSTTPDNRFSTNGVTGGPWIAVNRIKTNDEGHIYAATQRGLRLSTDEGETWINPVYIDENNSLEYTDICADIAIAKKEGSTSGQRVLVSFAGGRVYLSETGADETFNQINANGLLTGSRRTAVAMSESNPDVMYVLFNVAPIACLGGIYKSTDGGESFFKLLERHDDFSPMQGGADYCQGVYDVALECDPKNENIIFIGGVELWRFDGSLTRVATEGGNSDINPVYVHADKHFFYYSPNDKRRMYVTTDGGISKTENRGQSWQGMNKGYVTTQFYGITHFNGGGTIIGGTQDNGTLAVLGENPNDPKFSYQVSGGDGIDCAASQNMPIVIVTSQNGSVSRVDVSAGSSAQPSFALISPMGSGGPFRTVVKLWENIDEPTSKDSILFSVEGTEFAIATGNGSLQSFNESVTPLQPAAIVIENSVKITAGSQELTIDPQDNSKFIGDGEGTIAFNEDRSIDIDITFDEAPPENANILIFYDERYNANDVLFIESQNLRSLQGGHVFEHRLESDLNPGDVLKIQDPVQSFLFSTGAEVAGGGIRFYRNVLNAQSLPPDPIAITGVGGNITCVEVGNDGDVAFIGNSNGNLFRVSGLKTVYTQEDADQNITVQQITSGSGWSGPITGVALDRTDNNRVVITGGGYNQTNRVFFTENALSPSPTWRNVHGDLAPMPIYDAEFNVNDPNMVILGTEFGLWATGDISAASVSWSDENDEMTYIPVYDVQQQWLPFEKASNTGMIYVGTHGRGLWQSGSVVGVPEFGAIANSEKSIDDFTVFPNPVQGSGNIKFESTFNGTVDMKIYDISGRQVKAWQERVVNGNNQMSFDTSTMKSGAYFAIISTEGKSETAKFLVMR